MPALTGIRFPLALWVVAHHIGGPGHMLAPVVSSSSVLEALVAAAWIALTVFFAISGFVLARRYRTTIWTSSALSRYAVARFARIYPVYLVSLVLILPIMWNALRHDVRDSAERAGLVANYVLLLQGWIRPSVTWNTPAWSLSAEVFFYACAPLLVLLVRTTSWPRVITTAAVACALPIALRLTMEAPIPKALLYFGDFTIGVAAAGLWDRLRGETRSLERIGPWLYIPSLVGGIGLLVWRDHFPSFLVFDTGIRLLSAMLVIGLACGGGALVRVLSSRVMLAGGRASYAIYILHIPVLWWYPRSPIHDALPSTSSGAVYVAIVIALALVVSHWYESAANEAIRRWFETRRSTQLSFGLRNSKLEEAS